MATEFTYSISSDFPSGAVFTANLQTEIASSSIAANVVRIDTTEDLLTIYFDADLTAGEKTILDGDATSPAGGLIAAHDKTKSLDTIFLSEIDNTMTTSTVFVLVSGMSSTPPAGNYTITFSGSMENDSRNKKIEVAIFIDGTLISHSSRRSYRGNIQQVVPFSCVTRATLDGSQTVEGRWRVDGSSSGIISERSLLISPI